MSLPREFFCRIPASLIKDAQLAPEAKLLYLVLAAHADARTGRTFVGLRTIERLMRCGRAKRERAQRELVRAGWLRLSTKPCARGRWGARIFLLSFCLPATVAPFERSGEMEQQIISQSQVSRSSSPVPRGVPASVSTSSD